MDLKEARGQIDRVDREIAQLFEERMKAAEAIAAYKREKGLPVEDKNREKAMIQQELEWVNPLYRPYFQSLLECMIGESKIPGTAFKKNDGDLQWGAGGVCVHRFRKDLPHGREGFLSRL